MAEGGLRKDLTAPSACIRTRGVSRPVRSGLSFYLWGDLGRVGAGEGRGPLRPRAQRACSGRLQANR
jgi:hypothetical protein